jgi:hypothetical protein
MVQRSRISHGQRAQRIASLRALKIELKRMIEGCSHGHVAECHVIEVLADDGKCLHYEHGHP